MAKVLKPFYDMQEGHKYMPGDDYKGPRKAEHEKAGLIEKTKKKPGPKANKKEKAEIKNK